MNINEIAGMAGVSRATVSRYLNDGYVSKEKKEQIRKVIEETGYQPSSHAQTMRTNKTNVIGVIIPKISSESVGKMVGGISHVLSAQGYQILLADTENDEEEEVRYLRLFRENYVDGVIFIATIFTEEHLRWLRKMTIPVVILGQYLPEYNCVYHDEISAARDMTEHLLRNSRKIGFLGVTVRDREVGQKRMEGFLEACRNHGVKGDCIPEGSFRVESGYEQMKELLERNPEVDTVFCATDSLATGASVYLREQGIKIPEQIQLAGVGDSSMSRIAYPRITTIHYFYTTSGMEAAKMMLQLLNGEQIPESVMVDYRLEIHESTR
ncbi:MAG: LacI family DNA-binding transcriptional regulator [Clostridiales bacterium]|nr:LacI family DNA-binding transcriptional regulator [Clostridiales bacterium]